VRRGSTPGSLQPPNVPAVAARQERGHRAEQIIALAVGMLCPLDGDVSLTPRLHHVPPRLVALAHEALVVLGLRALVGVALAQGCGLAFPGVAEFALKIGDLGF